MITVKSVAPESPAAQHGIKPKDKLVRMNGHSINDCLDYAFYSNDRRLSLILKRNERILNIRINNPGLSELGLAVEDFRIKMCSNKCIFCFVDQMPRGFRKTLYIKDEDYRLSFLHGAYICATGLSKKDLNRIVSQKLSPLYISVHATDQNVRQRMLGIRRIPPVVDILSLFAKKNIFFNTQVVLCPGINDGPIFDKTVDDLSALYPHTVSIAVVPVGLTAHRKKLVEIKPVTRSYAAALIRTAAQKQKQLKKKLGKNILFLADEFYIKAGKNLPLYKHYGDFVQYDNGVGMMRDFSHRFKRFIKSNRNRGSNRRIGILTGKLGCPFIRELMDNLGKTVRNTYSVIPVENRVFGRSVTVTGLLCGSDLVRAAKNHADVNELLFIPPNCLNGDNVTLDDMTTADMAGQIGKPVKILEDFKELV